MIKLNRSYENVALSDLSIYYKNKQTNKKSAPTWNEKFELSDRSYYLSDVLGCFNYIMKKHQTVIYNPPIRIYICK